MDKNKLKENKQLFLVLGFIFGAFFISWILQSSYEPVSKKQTKERQIFVDALSVSTSSSAISFDVSGVVRAKNEIDIVPQVSGKVVNVSPVFFDGGAFDKDELLFEIEPDDYALQVQQKEALVYSARTLYELEWAKSRAAVMEWKREHATKKVPDLVGRKLQLDEAKAKVRSAQAELENAQLNLERTKFALPFAGRVINSDIGLGRHIVASQSYGRVFDRDLLEVKSSLTDSQLKWLFATKNPTVEIVIKYLGQEEKYAGMFKRGAAVLDQNTAAAQVYFGFKKKVKQLIPGVFAKVKVTGPKVDDLMLLPLQSLQNGDIVWVIKNGALVKWKPQIIYVDGDNIVVKAHKEQKIDIVVNRLFGGIEGMKVNVNEVANGK